MSSPPSIVEVGLEGAIDNFIFRQCPAEFQLKINQGLEGPKPQKGSLLHISHLKGIIMFPHEEKGQLGYSPIHKLAESQSIKIESLEFPEDESFINSMCLDSSEEFLFVSKASNKIYVINLAVEKPERCPFIIGTSNKLDSSIVQCVSFHSELWVLLENGKLSKFEFSDEGIDVDLENEVKIEFDEEFGAISEIKNEILAIGSKKEPKIYFLDLNDEELNFQSIEVPFKELNCGSKGISSINLLQEADGILFSCIPDNPETDDVPLLLLENIYNGQDFKFSTYFDPCASRPPRKNQFYFINTPFSADNLSEFVVLGNFASPDIGICGRLGPGESLQTFYIDNDEGLAQLPFFNDSKVICPVGLALDLSSKTPLENSSNPDGETYPPSPILWVLADSGHLCPFSMLKTDETEPFEFMRTVPAIESFKNENVSEFKSESESDPEFLTEEEDEVSEAPCTPGPKVVVAPVSTPQTPSKVPLEQLASLQKSAEIKPIEIIKPVEIVNPLTDPIQRIEVVKTADVVKPIGLVKQPVILSEATATELVNVAKPIKTDEIIKPPSVLELEMIKKEEKMESIDEGAYKNILLAEIASAHTAMQEDLFTLKQLSMKNSLLLRRNSQKYFNSLESLETYAGSLEKLLSSSDKVFLDIKDKLDGLNFNLKELVGRTRLVKSSWNRIKQDNKINWEDRLQVLTSASSDLIEGIDRVKNFTRNPTEASKYQATLKCFVNSTQEKVQVLMAHLSGIFVSQPEDMYKSVYAEFGSLSLSSPRLSGDNLLEQLNGLNLERGSHENLNSSSCTNYPAGNRYKSLLTAVKARGARLLIPSKISPSVSNNLEAQKLKLSSADETLISSFIAAIKLTDQVPEFAEIEEIAKLSLNENETHKPIPVAIKAESKFEFKPVEKSKKHEIKSEEPSTKPEFSSKPLETSPTFTFGVIKESKNVAKDIDSRPTEPFSFSFKPSTAGLALTKSAEAESPKIPSIFTTSSQPEGVGSVLKRESPLPSFDSLNFGGDEGKLKSDPVTAKPFPSIFGVKSVETSVEGPSSSISISSPANANNISPVSSLNTLSQASIKLEESVVASPGFGFRPPSTPVQEPSPVLGRASVNQASFSFAPATSTATSAFSITNKPTFTSPPVFGATSMPKPTGSFGSLPPFPSSSTGLKPAFGQSIFPSATGASSSGFAAFAASSAASQNTSGFSSVAFQGGDDKNGAASPSSGLTFASFLPSDKDKDKKTQQTQPNSTSTFSFTGFRE